MGLCNGTPWGLKWKKYHISLFHMCQAFDNIVLVFQALCETTSIQSMPAEEPTKVWYLESDKFTPSGLHCCRRRRLSRPAARIDQDVLSKHIGKLPSSSSPGPLFFRWPRFFYNSIFFFFFPFLFFLLPPFPLFCDWEESERERKKVSWGSLSHSERVWGVLTLFLSSAPWDLLRSSCLRNLIILRSRIMLSITRSQPNPRDIRVKYQSFELGL